MKVMCAVFLICQEEIYFKSAYTPRQSINVQYGQTWDKALNKIRGYDLTNITIEIS